MHGPTAPPRFAIVSRDTIYKRLLKINLQVRGISWFMDNIQSKCTLIFGYFLMQNNKDDLRKWGVAPLMVKLIFLLNNFIIQLLNFHLLFFFVVLCFLYSLLHVLTFLFFLGLDPSFLSCSVKHSFNTSFRVYS